MDNVTHSLAGLVLAEAAVRLRARVTGTEPNARFRSTAAISSMIAANLPDADLFYTGVGGDRLAYMLHHRGYTHTFVAALAGAILVWAAAMLVWRWRAHATATPDEARWLAGLLLVCIYSHLALDWTNSYGVHLLWPVDDRWSYGDSVFIVEPWFWVVAVPLLVASTPSRAARVFLSLVLIIGLALAWRVALVSPGAATALTLGAVVMILVARTLSAGARAAVAVAGWLGVTIVMAAGAAGARRATLRALRAADANAEVLDVVVTPLPSNAVCASVITVERSASSYRVVTARASAVPRITPAWRCGARRSAGPMFRDADRPSTPAVQWDGEWTASDTALATLARESCPALAALRFIRVPVWRGVTGSMVMLGDVRFGGASGDGFSDVIVPRREAGCSTGIPPWTPPRQELLDDRLLSGGAAR